MRRRISWWWCPRCGENTVDEGSPSRYCGDCISLWREPARYRTLEEIILGIMGVLTLLVLVAVVVGMLAKVVGLY